jgi:hypothetical protein
MKNTKVKIVRKKSKRKISIKNILVLLAYGSIIFLMGALFENVVSDYIKQPDTIICS